MLSSRALSAILTALGLASVAQANSSQNVDLGYAIYQGTFNSTTNITEFLGIRFAAPPVGKLRFQAPVPPPNVRAEGVQLADTDPPQCPQAFLGLSFTSPFRGLSSRGRRQNTEIEDCLFLNVHVSGEVNTNAQMPVVFWIHGGGYLLGNASLYNGADLIREAGGGIVIVEIQYRLGLFGFLPGTETKQKGALNAGILDQNFALQWVQQNIHLFGGDPNRVTIWGESAGAGSVVQHLVAHGGNTQPPLFHAAITSSTFLPSQYYYDDPIPEKLYSETVEIAGCSNATDTFQCLVDADAATIQNANSEINSSGFFGTFVFVVVVDGEFIVERPMRTIARGRLNSKTLLAMGNPFEGTAFVNQNFSAEMTVTDYVIQLFPLFSGAQIKEAARQYANIGLETVNDQAIAIMGESIFICPTYQLLAAYPGRSHKGVFAIPPGLHGDDVTYYFPHFFGMNGPPYANTQFSASLAGSYLGFAKFGDPNIHPVADDITPNWKTYNHGHTEMLFNRTEDLQPDIRPFKTDQGLLKRCAFWKSVARSIPQ